MLYGYFVYPFSFSPHFFDIICFIEINTVKLIVVSTNRAVEVIIRIDIFVISAIIMLNVLIDSNSNEDSIDALGIVTFLVRHMIKGSGRK